MKLLFLNKKGPISFEDLRTVNGITYATFVEESTAMGRLTSSNHKRSILQAATETQMLDQMRKIFAYHTIYFDLSQARELFAEFAVQLCEDYFARTNDQQLAIRLGLIRICEILSSNG